MCLVTGFQPPLAVATDRNYTGALEYWDKSVSAEKAAKCSLACRYHNAPSPRANAPSPLYWGKLSGAGACWTWRTARWSPHKAGVLASPEHTAPYGSADVQSSWEAAEDNKTMWQMTPSAWQRQELCIPMCSHPRSHWQGGAKLNKQPRCISGQSIPFNAKLKRDRSCYLLWTLSSTFSVEKAFTSKSTPQVCQREREDSCEIRIRTSADVSESFCTSETGRLLPAANYPGLPPLSQTSLITVLAYPPVLQCFW